MASSVNLATNQASLPADSSSRHRFSVAQYREMIQHGMFAEDEPIEFIRGEVVRKMPIGNARAAVVKNLNRLLSARLPADLLVSIQDPIATEDSEPEPDVAILKFSDDFYASRRPVAMDVRLLIEVADSSLAFDREIKGSVYAAAGVIEYWIVNLNNATIEVYLDPQVDEARYATARTVSAGDVLIPRAIPSLTLKVEELL